MEQALDHIRWYQYVHQSMYGKPKGVREVRMYDLNTGGFQSYETSIYYDTEARGGTHSLSDKGGQIPQEENYRHQVHPTIRNQE